MRFSDFLYIKNNNFVRIVINEFAEPVKRALFPRIIVVTSVTSRVIGFVIVRCMRAAVAAAAAAAETLK